MPISSGTKLSHYEIIAPLGVGGMGEVYRAHDNRLSRDVAIKILPSELSSHSDRLRRFEQEARSASALNHPNIITIHDIGTADSFFFIAMEYVEGKTLREILSTGPIAPRKAVQIAAQIAEGLAKAHEAGIVHRDLKPENIMVSSDGYVKILDFGLAKLIHSEAPKNLLSQAPTVTRQTEPGVVLGTVVYMSPEQASGSEVRFQSDQFSLGAILYEMFTGKRAFQKKTTAETMAAIINQEPEPITSSGHQIPPPVRWAIERCLQKDPADRYASTLDLARDLLSIREHFSEVATSTEIPVAGVGVPPSSKRKRHKLLDIVAVSLIVILAALSYYLWTSSNTVETGPFSVHRLTYRRGTIYTSRFAPDGQTIVYSASFDGQDLELYQTRTERFESRSLGISNADLLSISKSGEMLVLLRKEKNVLAQVPITGGLPRELAEDIYGADWAPDGNQMAISRLKQGRWYLEYPAGKVLYESVQVIDRIRFSPGGDLIAFDEHSFGASNGVIRIVDLKGKQIAASQNFNPSGVAWDSNGTEVWFTTLSEEAGGGDELRALSVSGASRVVARFATAFIGDISSYGRLLITFADFRGSLMAAVDGEESERELSWLDQPEVVDISPDRKTVLIHERGSGSESPSGTIFIRNMDRSPAVRLAAGTAVCFSPDGKWVLGSVGSVGDSKLILVPVGPGTVREFQFEEFQDAWPIGFLPEGQDILFRGVDRNQQARFYTLKISGGEPRAITEYGVDATEGKSISPDGKFVLGRDKERKLHIYPIAGGEPRPLPGVQPREQMAQWSQDGSSVFVFTPRAFPLKVYRVDAATGDRELFKEIVPPDPVGIINFSSVRFATDEKTYAYNFRRSLGTLYLLDAVK